MHIDLKCTGTAAECLGAEVMGIDAEFNAAEKKPAAIEFLKHNWRGKITHLFNENIVFSQNQSACWMCYGASCRVRPDPDIMSGGYPCPALSQQRQKNGKTMSTSSPKLHPLYGKVMEEFLCYLRLRRPRMSWFEEIPSFMKGLKHLNGRSPMVVVSDECRKIGYHTIALLLEHRVFCNMTRTLVFMVGALDEAGGARGAAWVERAVLRVLDFRALSVPTNLMTEVIDVTGRA